MESPKHKKARLTKKISDSLYDSSSQAPTLLYVPLNDLQPSQTVPKTTTSTLHSQLATQPIKSLHHHDYDETQGIEEEEDQILLMQLPSKGLSLQDILITNSSTPQTPNQPISESENATVRIIGANENSSSSSACLVVESTGKSFTLQRVETSNALIVLPSGNNDKTTGLNNVNTKNHTIPKRYGRLVANPSSSFLELKERRLNQQDLRDLLSHHVYHPIHFLSNYKHSDEQEAKRGNNIYEESDGIELNSKNENDVLGLTVSQLSTNLQCSRIQVIQALKDMCAYELPMKLSSLKKSSLLVNDIESKSKEAKDEVLENSLDLSLEHRYCLLDEEVETQAVQSIISAIVENEDEALLQSTSTSCSNTSSKTKLIGSDIKIGVMDCKKDWIIKQSVALLKEHQSSPLKDTNQINHEWYPDVIEHCLKMLEISSKMEKKSNNNSKGVEEEEMNDSGKENKVFLDIQKIAIFLAHQVFNSRSNPWPVQDFVKEWHSLMPVVGKDFEPTLDILKGIGLPYESNSSELTSLSTSIFAKHQIPPHPPHKGSKPNANSNTTSMNEVQSYLKYFPERKLSLNPKIRFDALFQEKEQWQLHQLEPYINALVKVDDRDDGGKSSTAGQMKTEMLLKYTCTVEDENGVTWYRSR